MLLLIFEGEGPAPPPTPTPTPAGPPIIGSSADILARIKRLIPNRWFAWNAPYRDAVIGGLSDLGSWCYSLILYAQKQARLATATGPFLDIFAYDFTGRYLRRNKANDAVFRAKIKATVLQERVTRAGMNNAVTLLVGTAPTILEFWNTGDCGGFDVGGCGYDVAGAWGSYDYPAQFLITVNPGPNAGIPDVDGYGGYSGGYDVGAIEYTEDAEVQVGISNQDVYDVINATKPTGSIGWTKIL